MSKEDLRELVKPYQKPANFPKIDSFEKLLIGGMLERAFMDLRLRTGQRDITGYNAQALRREAEEWIAYDGDEEWTFRWCCNQVELDYADTRSKLRVQGLLSIPTWVFSEDQFFRAEKKQKRSRRKRALSNARRYAKSRRQKPAHKQSRSKSTKRAK